MILKKIIVSVLALSFFTSCEIINPEEEIPSYIQIDTFNVSTNYSTQGTRSSKITDAWVFVDEKVIGAFELPAKFPVLAGGGTHKIRVQAGIMISGISTTRSPYAFYSDYELKNELIPGAIKKISPTVSYVAHADIIWREDFEGVGLSLKKSDRSDTTIIATSKDVFEGAKSGFAHLTADKPFVECSSFDAFPLPYNTPVYLELNYKTNITFTVGVIANKINQVITKPALNLSPTLDEKGNAYWNKIYINLTSVVSSESDALNFRIFLGALKPASVNEGEIYIDNIKLIY